MQCAFLRWGYPSIASVLPPVGYCLLYTSDAADDLIGVDLGGRRIIKKKKGVVKNEYDCVSQY